MSTPVRNFREYAQQQAEELLTAIVTAETMIVSTIERECEALRTGRLLAAEALHLRLTDAARLYLNATRAARASLGTIERVLPGSTDRFEGRRKAFADLLKVELAVLTAERVAADEEAARRAQSRAPARVRNGLLRADGGRISPPGVRVVVSNDARTAGPSRSQTTRPARH